jgi:hypothetical protein
MYIYKRIKFTVLNINLKWIRDLNIRLQTLKLVWERVGNTLELIGIGKDFLDGTPAAQQLRDSIDKCYHKTKKLLLNKRNGL